MRAYEFLNDYFNEDENFIIAQKHPKRDGKVKHHHTMLNIKNENLKSQLGRFYYMNKDDGVDIYFSLNSYKKQKSFYPSRKEEFVEKIKSFYFDIDKGDIENKKAEIIKLFGKPTYEIESSRNKFQFIYKFNEPYLVNSVDDRDKFKQLLKGLCYNFDIDKTFDTARIFRLVGHINKKLNNNNFEVTVIKNENYYNFERFEEIAKNYLMTEEPKKINTPKKASQTLQKTKALKKSNNGSPETIFTKYEKVTKKINRKYKELLNKYNQDYSTADLGYARWLRTSKRIEDDEVIIKKLFEARGYKNMMEKHGYQIGYYIENILEKSRY